LNFISNTNRPGKREGVICKVDIVVDQGVRNQNRYHIRVLVL